jgi:hypothetical protein
VRGMINVIDAMTLETNAAVVNYDGSVIPY